MGEEHERKRAEALAARAAAKHRSGVNGWSEQDLQYAIERRAAGDTTVQIGAVLGRHRNAVISKLRRAGVVQGYNKRGRRTRNRDPETVDERKMRVEQALRLPTADEIIARGRLRKIVQFGQSALRQITA